MPFVVVPGLPWMQQRIDYLMQGIQAGTLSVDERKLAKKLFKAIVNLSSNPAYPGLQTHEITELSDRFSSPPAKHKVYQSHLENQTPAAGRLFRVYGPKRGMITLVGLEPHPEDAKRSGYSRVQLSRMPTPEELAEANAD